MFYPTAESIIKAKKDAEKYKSNMEQELQKLMSKIDELDAQANEYANAGNFESFDKVSDEIVKFKTKVEFYADHLSKYHDGEFPQINPEDICKSWNEVSKPLIKKVEKAFEDVAKARDEYIAKTEKYADVVADALKVYYAYRTQLPASAFNRLGEPIYQFNELPRNSYSKIADISKFIYDADIGKHRYLTKILDRGVYWEE